MITTLWQNLWEYVNSADFLARVVDNRFYLILIVIALSYFKRRTFSSMFVAAVVNIPGTVLHETAHFLVGFMLNAKPTTFTLWPKLRDGAYVMGSVGFRNVKFYNAFPSAMAPLLLLPLGWWLNEYFLITTIWRYICFVLLETIIIENAIPSSTDFAVAFDSPLGVLLYGALIFVLLIVL